MSKLSSIDKYNKPFPSTLRKLIERKNTTIKAVADYIGVSRQAVSQYQDGSTQPNADTIIKIAEFFNVSADYLLTGKSKSIDESFNIVCDITGLSSSAVRKIVNWKNADDFHKFWSDYISRIIESENSEELLMNIAQTLGFAKWEVKSIKENRPTDAINFIDMQIARLWYISKILTDIVEEMAKEERLKGGENNGSNK